VSINIAQIPDSYALTLTLSRTRERGCGTDYYWRFSYSGSILFRNSTSIPVLAWETENFNGKTKIGYENMIANEFAPTGAR
jgi:hypothetical protein